jgi:hypothetical protein
MPDDIRDIFSPSYFAGARLHSDSWGGGYWYDSYALETDEYAYLHDDFLAFFAGGNDGQVRTYSRVYFATLMLWIRYANLCMHGLVCFLLH